LEEQFLPTLKGFCELFPEPEIRDKIKQDLNKIQNENDPNIRIRLEIQQLKYIQYMLEMDLKAKEREITHKDEIIDIKKKDNLAFIIKHQSSFVYTIAFVPVLFYIYQTTMSDAFPYAPPCGCFVFENEVVT